MITQLRLLLAEKLLGWAVALMPKDHPDSVRLTKAALDYISGITR